MDGKEKGITSDADSAQQGELQRQLSGRHLNFIAIGGTIGTGFFLGTGTALVKAGPASCLISYIFVGSILWSVMVCLGEMATYIPTAGAFSSYATRFVDSSLGFAVGWLYWFGWAITYALSLVAAGLIIQYWKHDINLGILIAVFWVVFTLINYLPVGIYGELEMWLSSLKVITIAGFIIFGICIAAGVGQEGVLGFKYWSDPGAFNEYLVPGDVWARAGVKVLPDIINAVLLTAVLSAANSNVYSGSRVLLALAEEGQAPAIFKKTNRYGIPVMAVGGTAAFGLLGFLNLSSDGGKVFNWLLNISGVAGLTTWASTCLSHLAFMRALKAQGIPRSELPYVSRFQPYTAIYGLFFNVLITLTQGFTVFINWNVSDFFAAYISLILFVVLWAGHKLWHRQPSVNPATADLVRGRYDLNEERSAADGGV
ncbi:hypothetical protein CHGG_10302 [Chaetomium globosum CBS 148.51]|uniref:Amino acid permease/ SLC12A domain-containing protein n=1 Tax=Chaetomium globosum (strain ATCC 6205 / CBS 148.51 / DSM 1962 / NBRC 6347 / NRRL 1970) TaxID=306901 RepID=Q2GP02_CHAGB|nr:uncharacterized protein CHGG_10302 [Chaetomium globosum CBS 148.51]EAQ83898.1 hypothetical protein CHGG_10302 [Chaetomium globosum CBS 148.51]